MLFCFFFDLIFLFAVRRKERQLSYCKRQMSGYEDDYESGSIGADMSEVISKGATTSEWWNICLALTTLLAIFVLALVFGILLSNVHTKLEHVDDNCKGEDFCAVNDTLNEAIAAAQKRPCDPAGVPEDGTGCYYSSNKVLQAKQDIADLWDVFVSPANMLFNSGFDWLRFQSGVQEYRYANTPGKKASYPALKQLKKVRQSITQAAALPQTTDMERGQLLLNLQEVNFTLTLYDLNFPHSEYEGGWNLHPALDSLFMATFLPFFSGEPDYNAKALLYMQNLLASEESLLEFYTDAVNVDSPPQVESEYSCDDWTGDVIDHATPGLRTLICDVMAPGPEQTDCYAADTAIDAAAFALATYYVNTYCPVAAVERSAPRPGIGQVHNGNLTYEAWLRYMSGIDMSIADRHAAAQAAIDEGVLAVTALLNTVHGITYNDWLAAMANLENPLFNVCFDTTFDVTRHFEHASTNVSNVLPELLSYLPRAPHKIEDFGNCCFYSTGDYDPYRNEWTSAGRFLTGIKGLNNASQQCVDRYVHSMTMHESWTGHHIHSSLERQIKCEIDTVWSFFSGYGEGWSAYTELLCNKTILCDEDEQPNERIMNLYWHTLGTGGVLRADIELNSYGKLLTECEQTNIDTGGGFFADKFCTRSYQWPGQLAGYLQGSRRFDNKRKEAELILGGAFSLQTFNMLISKFNHMPWSQMDLMIDTWIQWTLDRPTGLALPWGPTIDKVLFKSADPVVGTAFVIPDNGAVLINNVQTQAQIAIEQEIANNPAAKAIIDRMTEFSQRNLGLASVHKMSSAKKVKAKAHKSVAERMEELSERHRSFASARKVSPKRVNAKAD